MTRTDNPVLAKAWGSFLGVQCSQIAIDFVMWDRFFSAHPIKHMLELGTGTAGFSAFLAMNCKWRGATFATFDTWDSRSTVARLNQVFGMGIDLHLADVYTAGKVYLESLLKVETSFPLLLYCDNGEKIREVRELGALLRPGDYLAVHDWYFEIDDTDITIPLQALMQPECESVGSMTRWFKKV